MKNAKELIITLLLTFFFSSLVLILVKPIFIPKWIDAEGNRMSYIIKGFYKEPKDSIDVLFTGNSDVYRAISPMEIYNLTGYTSYNFVAAGERMWIAYPMLEEALRFQKPKVVFFNVDELYFTSQTTGNAHKVYDNMRFGLPLIKGVLDPNYENATKLSHFFPIFAYHDRYKELTLDDFRYAYADYTDYLKGLDLVATVKPYESAEDYMEKSDDIKEIPQKNIEYLDAMRELCEKKGIELVLLQVPSSFEWSYPKHNAVNEYAEKYGLKFLDLNLVLDEMDFDWSTDTADEGEHMNIYGAEKVSKYIAHYLEENFSLTNHNGDARWDNHYLEYKRFKERVISDVRD